MTGHAVLDDGLVIDLSAMTGMRVDPESRTVWVEGGDRMPTSTTKHRPLAWPRSEASSTTAPSASPSAAGSAT